LNVEVNVRGEILKVPVPGGDLSEEKIFAVNLSPEESLKSLPLPGGEDVAPHDEDIGGQQLNTFCDYGRNRRVGASKNEVKNTVATETIGNVVAGDDRLKGIKEITLNYAWWMKKQGYAESTIEARTKLIKILAKRGVDLSDPESVKEGIANQPKWSQGRKANAVDAYTTYLTMHGGTWNPPSYYTIKKILFIPTETEIDQLIAGCGRKSATLL
jgi:hypothetical protein